MAGRAEPAAVREVPDGKDSTAAMNRSRPAYPLRNELAYSSAAWPVLMATEYMGFIAEAW